MEESVPPGSDPPKVSSAPLVVLAIAAAILATLVATHASLILSTVYCAVVITLSLGLIVSLHFTEANLDPLDHMVSEYSLSPRYGTFMRSAFFLLGSGIGGIAYTSHTYLHMGDIYAVVVTLASLFTMGMGVFSMHSAALGEIHTSPYEGMVHDICCAVAFGMAVITMLWNGLWPPTTVSTHAAWFRAVGWMEFNVAAVVMLLFILLGTRKVAVTSVVNDEDQTHPSTAAKLIVKDFKNNRMFARKDRVVSEPPKPIHQRRIKVSSTRPRAVPRYIADPGKVTAAILHGMGLMERILIFMFIEWTLVLTQFMYSMHGN